MKKSYLLISLLMLAACSGPNFKKATAVGETPSEDDKKASVSNGDSQTNPEAGANDSSPGNDPSHKNLPGTNPSDNPSNPSGGGTPHIPNPTPTVANGSGTPGGNNPPIISNPTPTVNPPVTNASCTVNGVTIPHGGSHYFYSSSSSLDCASVRGQFSCNNGVASGSSSSSYPYGSCTPLTVASVETTSCQTTNLTGAQFSCPANQVAKAFGYSGGYKVQCCQLVAKMSDSTTKLFKTADSRFEANVVGGQTWCPLGYLLAAGSQSGATCVQLKLDGTNKGIKRGDNSSVEQYTIYSSGPNVGIKTCSGHKLAYSFGDINSDRDPDTLFCNSVSID